MTIKIGGISGIYWLFAIIYTFMVWGFWWGLLNIIIPFAPLVDLVCWIIANK